MLLGVSFKLLSAFLFTVMASLIRAVGTDVPTGQVVLARSLFALVPLMIWLAWRGNVLQTLRTKRPFGHLLRSAIGVSSMFCMFAGLARLPLPDATVLGYASPLMTIVFAAILLRERVLAHRWTAVGVGLAGVVIMLWPQLESGALASVVTGDGEPSETAVGAAFALGATVLTAAAMIQIRRLTQSEGTGAIVFYFTVWSTVIGLLISGVFGWVMPDPRTATLLVATGLVGGVAQILLTESYRHADASLIAPFEYTSILWAFAIGFLAFGDLPSSSMVVGGAIVVGSGVAVVVLERRLGIKRARVRKASPPSPGA